MECSFSNPVDYEGNTPTDSFTPWNFENSICTIDPTATPEASLASPSAYLDIASGSAIANAIHDSLFFVWVFFALALFLGFFFMGTYIFRK